MSKSSSAFFAAIFATGSLAPNISHASGTLPRAWASAQFGADSASCGALTSPCKTFQYMYDAIVAVGGMILVRDPGAYGPVVIKNALSIVNANVGDASVSVSTGDAIAVQAPTTASVLIKGLVIDGGGTATNGVNATGFGNIAIQDCTVLGFKGNGVAIVPQAGPGLFAVAETLVRDNGTGVLVQGNIANAQNMNYVQPTGTLTRVKANANGVGVLATSLAYVEIDQADATANATTGISVTNNGFIYLTKSTAVGNPTGVKVSGGFASTYGDNSFIRNGVNVSGSLTAIAHN